MGLREPGASAPLKAPFPYFGGKSTIAAAVWRRLGAPKHYIEPFCGSAAMLLAAPRKAPLEVVCDRNGFIANFWRAGKHQPGEVAAHADYPVSHIDLGARHVWLMEQRARLGAELQDADWPGDAKAAGWWLWGQCSWIGSGWCDWEKALGQVPHASDAGRGVQALGRVPHASNAGRGVQALGKVPRLGARSGVQALGAIPHAGSAGMGIHELAPSLANNGGGREMLTSAGAVAWNWLHRLAERLERVRVGHGDWSRFLNHHYGQGKAAVFLDPPYRKFEKLYGVDAPVADQVAEWAKAHGSLRIALCGHRGDYDLPGWDALPWSRGKHTYGGSKTTAEECVWFSPGCEPAPEEA